MCEGKHVFIVGGGNSAGQAVMNFARHAREVTMIVRGASLAATLSRYLIDRIERMPNVTVRYGTTVDALQGDGRLEAIVLRTEDGARDVLPATHLFVCIGGAPNTEWARDTDIIRNPGGYLVTGSDLYDCPDFARVWPLERRPYYLETSVPGSFAAGDVRSGSVKRVASAVGEGAMAVTFVHRFLGEDAHRLSGT